MPRDIRIVRDLAIHCRPLAIVQCCTSFIVGLIMIAAVAGAEGLPQISRTSNFHDRSHAMFWIILSISALSTIASTLFLSATYIKSMWLTLPYFITQIVLILLCAASLALFVRNLIDQHLGLNLSIFSAFGYHIIYYDGAFRLFGSILLLGLQIWAAIPVWKFFNECRLIQKERVDEQKQKQRKAYFQDYVSFQTFTPKRPVEETKKHEDVNESSSSSVITPSQSQSTATLSRYSITSDSNKSFRPTILAATASASTARLSSKAWRDKDSEDDHGKELRRTSSKTRSKRPRRHKSTPSNANLL